MKHALAMIGVVAAVAAAGAAWAGVKAEPDDAYSAFRRASIEHHPAFACPGMASVSLTASVRKAKPDDVAFLLTVTAEGLSGFDSLGELHLLGGTSLSGAPYRDHGEPYCSSGGCIHSEWVTYRLSLEEIEAVAARGLQGKASTDQGCDILVALPPSDIVDLRAWAVAQH